MTHQKSIPIYYIEEWSDIRIKNEQKCESNLLLDLNVAVLWVAALSFLCLAVDQDDCPKPLPPNWAGGKIDPNTVVQGLLTQVVNHSIATIHLTSAGLDPSARIMLRTVMETSWLTVSVVNSTELMTIYCKITNENPEALRAWNKHFSSSKLRRHMRLMDEQIVLESNDPDSDLIFRILQQTREYLYKFFSETAHNQFDAVLQSAWVWLPNKEHAPSRLFGRFSMGCRSTLTHLSSTTLYLTHVLFRLMRGQHGFLLPQENALWIEAATLMYCATHVLVTAS